MEENIEQRILSWLNTQGYGVEMKVAKSLNAIGCQVLQSWFYSDPETGTSREIDVLALMSDIIGILNVYSVIECKKSSKPWVLFTSDRAVSNRVWSFAIMNDVTKKAIVRNIKSMVGIDWFMKDGRIAYGVTEAFTSKGDETFKAGMTATKAALALLKNRVNSQGVDRNVLTILFPTVVLDGRLFECYLGSDGNPVLGEIDSAFLLFPVEVGEHAGASVRIVTLGAFHRYCDELVSVYNALRQGLADDMEQLAISLGFKPEAMREIMQHIHASGHQSVSEK